jgi:hypothetical protein
VVVIVLCTYGTGVGVVVHDGNNDNKKSNNNSTIHKTPAP